jgi:hypothetical protein
VAKDKIRAQRAALDEKKTHEKQPRSLSISLKYHLRGGLTAKVKEKYHCLPALGTQLQGSLKRTAAQDM